MSKVFGLLDTLEAAILEGKRVPLSDKVILDEKKMLAIIDKIRIVVNSADDHIEKSIDISTPGFEDEWSTDTSQTDTTLSDDQVVSVDLAEAKQEAQNVKEEANDYADYVLANIQTLLTKLQKNIITLEKTVEQGRGALDQVKETEGQNNERTEQSFN